MHVRAVSNIQWYSRYRFLSARLQYVQCVSNGATVVLHLVIDIMMTSSNGNLVNSPHKGRWRGALIFPLICAWINGWVNNREAGDLRCHGAHYDVIVMTCDMFRCSPFCRAVCTILFTSGPLFTKRTDVLPQDLVKSRSRAIRVETFPIAALKFDRHIGSSAAELPVTF